MQKKDDHDKKILFEQLGELEYNIVYYTHILKLLKKNKTELLKILGLNNNSGNDTIPK